MKIFQIKDRRRPLVQLQMKQLPKLIKLLMREIKKKKQSIG